MKSRVAEHVRGGPVRFYGVWQKISATIGGLWSTLCEVGKRIPVLNRRKQFAAGSSQHLFPVIRLHNTKFSQPAECLGSN